MNFYWMQLVVGWIEPWLTPLARYLTKSRYLIALRDGFQLAMPFVIIGSICVPLLYPPFLAGTVSNHDGINFPTGFDRAHLRSGQKLRTA